MVRSNGRKKQEMETRPKTTYLCSSGIQICNIKKKFSQLGEVYRKPGRINQSIQEMERYVGTIFLIR